MVPTFTFAVSKVRYADDRMYVCCVITSEYPLTMLVPFLIGMMPGIQDMLKSVAEAKGLDYDEWLKGLKAKKQWHVEVY